MLAYVTLATATINQSQPTQDNTAAANQPQQDNKTAKVKEESKPITHTLIEEYVKLYRRRRSHCNVMDFDGRYIKNAFMKGALEEMSKFPKSEPR